jgi:hypothetical protein
MHHLYFNFLLFLSISPIFSFFLTSILSSSFFYIPLFLALFLSSLSSLSSSPFRTLGSIFLSTSHPHISPKQPFISLFSISLILLKHLLLNSFINTFYFQLFLFIAPNTFIFFAYLSSSCHYLTCHLTFKLLSTSCLKLTLCSLKPALYSLLNSILITSLMLLPLLPPI